MYEQCLECEYLSDVPDSDPCTAQIREQCPAVADQVEVSRNDLLDIKRKPLCDLWLAEIRRLYGNEVADKSIATYHYGWYRLAVAHRYQDDSVGNAFFYKQSYRRIQVVEIIENLRGREVQCQQL